MGKFIDITGKRFGSLVAIEPDRSDGRLKWKCKCDCGNIRYNNGYDLKSGKVKSCGCSRIDNLNGERFNRLLVLGFDKKIKRTIYWKCLCDCGNITSVRSCSLKSGDTKSCGCYQKEQTVKASTKHGKYNTRLYRIWSSMKQRCYNANDEDSYKLYGLRGIKVCNEWKDSFEVFYKWAVTNGYKNNLTIDRIDINGDYCPENCRWSTPKEQSNNTRRNRFIAYNGETRTLTEWSEKFGINYQILLYRFNLGWAPEKAFNTKPKNHKRIIEYNGESLSLRGWEERTGLNRHTISGRLNRGWTVEKALTAPSNRTYRKDSTKESDSDTLY